MNMILVSLLSLSTMGSPKTFIDYFRPTKDHGELSKTAWGISTVGPRDIKNGLEDAGLKQWNYWDGTILTTAYLPSGRSSAMKLIHHNFGCLLELRIAAGVARTSNPSKASKIVPSISRIAC